MTCLCDTDSICMVRGFFIFCLLLFFFFIGLTMYYSGKYHTANYELNELRRLQPQQLILQQIPQQEQAGQNIQREP
jgi:hypothetical protein